MNQKLWFNSIGYTFVALLMVLFTTVEAGAQITYSQNFNAGNGGFTGFVTFTGSTACGGAGGGVRTNLYSGNTTGNLTSPLIGTSLAGSTSLSYDYKVANWSANTTGTPVGWGSFNVQYGPTATGPWTTLETVNDANHVVSGTCATRMVTFTPAPGNLYVRFSASWTGGDYYLNFDNVSVTETPPPPCSGAPAPGNTVSSAASVCVNEAFVLSLQNVTPGSGVSYAWESSTDDFATAGTPMGTSSTQSIASQTVPTYYRCTVTCSGSSTLAPSVFVDQNGPTACYCVPIVTNGCTDGDVIAQVILNTLNNNSGTGCPSGLAGYSDYTADPLLTTTLVAGNVYGCQVWAGQWGENYAAWIDFNNDGFFDNVTEKIGFTTSTVAGSGSVGVLGSSATFPITISCNPIPGTYRLRVRAQFGTIGSAITPCGSAAYGETEDYLVTIDPPLPCPSPTFLSASNPTDVSVDLSWTAGCTETAWNVEYGATGFTPGTGTLVAATSTTATITGLACQTDYDFYVYADCGGAGGSLPSNVAASTTTLCPCIGTPAPGNTESSLASICDGGSVSLSLQNDVSAAGITYQWESSSDATFTAPVALGTGSTETGTVSGDTWFRCTVTCSFSASSATSAPVMVVADAVLGDDMATAISIPSINCLDSAYIDTVNTGIGCYTNTYSGQGTNDVWYIFTIAATTTVEASTCASGFDTYLHLLDGTGANIFSNDDNGPVCSGTRASFNQTLAAGTYFIVAEGFSQNNEIILNVSTGSPCNACNYPIVLDNSVTTTSTSGDVTFTPSTFPGIGWYEFRYRVSGAPTWTFGGTSGPAATHKLISGLSPATSYDVEARAMCTQQYGGAWSATVVFSTPVLQDCALPPAMSAAASGTSIALSWPAVTGAAWYEFQYKASSSATWLSGGSAGAAATSKSYVGLLPGTSYDFQARTICTNNIPSAWGGMISASTVALSGCELPPVLDLTAVTAPTSITISWPAVSGAAWYSFQYKESSSATWINGGTAGPGVTMKTYNSLLSGTSYDFQARTYCPNNQASAWSAIGTYSTDAGAPAFATVTDKADSDIADKSLTTNGQTMKVYPNPATDRVNVEVYFSNSTSNASIQLMDMSGRVVQVVETEVVSGSNTMSLDIQNLSTGMYTVLVYENGSLIHTNKLKKN